METANILLDIGSDGTTILAKSRVTPAEVAVLRLIHGDDAVNEIEVLADEAGTPEGGKRTHRQEIARLMEVYGKPTPEGGREARAVTALFPGAAARVFETFEELELPDDHFKTKTRSTAKRPERDPLDHDANGKKGGAAPADDDGIGALTIPQLKTLADEENVDLEGVTKKADIIVKIEAARAAKAEQTEDGADEGDTEDDDDGVEDMTDRPDGGNVFA